MKLLIETYVTTFIVTVSILICSSFINAELQINSAKDFHASCIALIEASDFDSGVILNCQQEAINKGYDLVVKNTISEVTASRVVCGNCKTIYPASEYSNCPACKSVRVIKYVVNRLYLVELTYKIDLLGDTQMGVINGYAR